MAELTSEQFEAAVARGRARLREPRAERAYHDVERDRIIVQLTTGIELGFPPNAVEGLQDASADDLKTIEIENFGLGIHFPAVDADLYVPALLEGILGSRRWMAARPVPMMPEGRPSRTSSTTMVAVFDTITRAEAAIAALVAEGVPTGAIAHFVQSSKVVTGPITAMPQPHGFWVWLTGKEETGTHQQHALYDKAIESGGIVVTVISDNSHVERIHDILEAHDPVDLDARHSQYSSSGAYGIMPDAAAMAAEAGQISPRGMEEVLTRSEEALQTRWRAVGRGTTRVRRNVVERPVEEQLRLRDETVTMFRRPVTAGTSISANAFTDHTISMNETNEAAVVAETVRVVEEVVLQKDVTERVETVRDTLRHEEVESDAPTDKTTTGVGTKMPGG